MLHFKAFIDKHSSLIDLSKSNVETLPLTVSDIEEDSRFIHPGDVFFATRGQDCLVRCRTVMPFYRLPVPLMRLYGDNLFTLGSFSQTFHLLLGQLPQVPKGLLQKLVMASPRVAIAILKAYKWVVNRCTIGICEKASDIKRLPKYCGVVGNCTVSLLGYLVVLWAT